MSRHVVSFSTGLSSALTVERVLYRFGPENMRVVFMDTLIEHEDNYRFKADMEARWKRSGIECVTLTEGRTPYQVAEDQNMIFNQRRHRCTYDLKIDPFMRWLEGQDAIVYVGIDFSEVHRCGPIERNYAKAGYEVEFPLLWKPIEYRPYTEVCREDWGIEPPKMYELGYSHANCGGFCVAQGQGDWIRTLINDPEGYEMVEQWERSMRAKGIDYAICRDQSNGQVTPKTLEEIRLEYEAGRPPSLFDAGCVRCGVGDFV